MKKKIIKRKDFVPTILAILFLALVWQFIALHIGFPAIFPPLIDLIRQVFNLFLSENFFLIVSITILRGITGFGFAFIIAFLFATIATFSVFWNFFFHPVIVVTRSIPVISFVLIALLWFSPPYLPVFIAFITMFPILYQNILTGFEHTDNKWIEMAKIFGKTSFQRFVSIYLPASKSFIFDGICTAMGFGWRAIIIGEVLAQPIHGIGTSMKQAQAYINLSEVIAWTIIAVVVSYLFDVIIKSIQKIHFEKKLPKASLFQIVSTCEMYELKEIKTQNMVKRFNDKLIIDSFNFVFDNVTVSCINGPSGKGKTTLIRLIAQLEKPDSGHIVLPESVHMAYCFQDIRLLPWLTVSENIAYAIHTKIIHKQEVSNLVSYLLDKMELSEHGHKYPHELSGGQQQRVDLARALAARSEILLFDEPLTGLDIDLKVRIVDFLSEWIAAYRPVVVWATHEDVHLSYTMVRKVFI